MTEPQGPHADVTRLLQEWREGREGALDRLIPLVYNELRVIAARHMSNEWRVSTFQTTALVNEAYLKLVGQRRVAWQNRAHFFAVAAQMMRRILVDNARRDLRPKHGAAAVHAPLEQAAEVAPVAGVDAVDALALDEALRKLEALDPDQARIVELRFFGGLTVEETAEVVGVSTATVKREWALARGWLYRELNGRDRSSPC
ncbi:MAG: RNA polymerase subunit sigma-70 [Acidobacteria bacterium]|nr:MAG: RNA polymerase subunit sigma-70 [Acidobacteriota bacterium]